MSLIALSLGGCAPGVVAAPGSRPPGPSAMIDATEPSTDIRLSDESPAAAVVYEATPATIWAALPVAYGKLGIVADVNDPTTLTYGARTFTSSQLGGKRTSGYVRCGNEGAGPSASSAFRRRLSILSSVHDAGSGRSALTIEVVGFATSVEGTSSDPVRCVTNGTLEQRLRSLVLDTIQSDRR
jgi:hypothetical protein